MDTKPDEIENGKYISPEEVDKVFEDAENISAETQNTYVRAAQYAGYTHDVIHALRDFYVESARLSQDDYQLQEYVASGVQFVSSITNEFYEKLKTAQHDVLRLTGISASAETFCNTSGTISAYIVDLDIPMVEPPPYFMPDQKAIEEKLAKIDGPLAALYREIGQVYYGTTADPARAAMAMMRQLFDHFFNELAPNDDVRASPYWKPKTEPDVDPILVTRPERITYAARTHISDEARADTIIANINNIQKAYKVLNRLHERGELSPDASRRALKTMQKFIETWTNALDG